MFAAELGYHAKNEFKSGGTTLSIYGLYLDEPPYLLLLFVHNNFQNHFSLEVVLYAR